MGGQSVVIKRVKDEVDILSITMYRTAISASSSGNNEIVTAVTGKRIKVISVMLIASDDVNIIFNSGGTSNLTGTLPLTANSGFVLPAPFNPLCHWIETVSGEALNLNLSGAISVGGCLTYYLE